MNKIASPRAFIAVVSGLVVLIGYMQFGEDGGLLMGSTSDGTPLYPVSSGSEDRHLLALGFTAYLVTFIAAVVGYARKRTNKTERVAYWSNLVFLMLIVFLVELDSSIVDSASSGDFLPLLGICVAALPSFLIAGNVFTRALSALHR